MNTHIVTIRGSICMYILEPFNGIVTFKVYSVTKETLHHLNLGFLNSRAQKKVYTFKMTVVKLNIAAF